MKHILSCFCLMALASACGSSDGGSGGALKTGVVTPAVNGRMQAGKIGGSWATDCKDNAVHEYVFLESGATFIYRYYEGADCKTEAAVYYLQLNKMATDMGGNQYELSAKPSHITKAATEVISETAVRAYNDIKACGYSDWVAKEPRSILNTSCLEVTPESQTDLKLTMTVNEDGMTMDIRECETNSKGEEKCEDVKVSRKN